MSPARAYIDELAVLLGERWVAKQLESLPVRQLAKRPGAIQELDAHPFIEFLARFRADSDAPQASTEEVVKYAHLAKHVIGASKLSGFSLLSQRLHSKDHFLDTVHECVVADTYSNRGLAVAFIAPTVSTRSPDLALTTTSGARIRVECKRIHDRSSALARAQKQYPTIISRILRALPPAQPPIVYVRFADVPTEPAVADVIKALRGVSRPVDWSCLRRDASAEVWIGPASPASLAGISFRLPPNVDMTRVYIQAMLDVQSAATTGSDSLLGYWGVALESDVATLTTNDFTSAIKKAAGQLPVEGPGVIAIQIPAPRENDLATYLHIVRELLHPGRHTRVNTVNLFWLQPTETEFPVIGGAAVATAYGTEVQSISHPNPRTPIPD